MFNLGTSEEALPYQAISRPNIAKRHFVMEMYPCLGPQHNPQPPTNPLRTAIPTQTPNPTRKNQTPEPQPAQALDVGRLLFELHGDLGMSMVDELSQRGRKKDQKGFGLIVWVEAAMTACVGFGSLLVWR